MLLLTLLTPTVNAATIMKIPQPIATVQSTLTPTGPALSAAPGNTSGTIYAPMATTMILYNNTTATGYNYKPGIGVELTDFGTTGGGLVTKFYFAYVTNVASPGTITIKFYSGTTASAKGALLYSFSLSGLSGSTVVGTNQAYSYFFDVPLANQFTLPNGAFGYSMTFDNIGTGIYIATGGTGNIDGIWVGTTYRADYFGTTVDASFYMKIEGTPADSTAPVISGFTMPATSTSLTVTGINITATDEVGGSGINGYYLSESPVTPLVSAPGWQAINPTSFTFSAQ
jgi:hypothetical protein